ERSKVAAEILDPSTRREIITVQKSPDGTVISETIVTKPVPDSVRVKLIDQRSKEEGVYNRASVAEHVAKREYDDLTAKVRASIQRKVESA
ncbi:unnamed protein product, partial [marine sediment metagenome]